MNQLFRRPYQYLQKTYLKLLNSIVFLPSLIAFGLMNLSVLMMYTENTEYSQEIKEFIAFGLVHGADNARFMLNALIGGIISLMVFNFSMVMVVLNQASSSFSPRVVPGVLTKKSHQTVLGIYLGTILYALLLIVNLETTKNEIYIPQLSIFVGMCLGILSLGLFVYFIHSISQAIQVDNIITSIYKQTKTELLKKDTTHYHHYETIAQKTKTWVSINSSESGYFRDCDRKELVKLAQKHDFELFIELKEGAFLVAGTPLFKINKDLPRDMIDNIQSKFMFYDNEYIQDNYVYGIKQLHEIALKALSPGINDPETAIRAINYITLVFTEKLPRQGVYLYQDKNNKSRVWEESYSIGQLIYRYVNPILHYGKADVMVVERLFYMIECLLRCGKSDSLDLPALNDWLLELRACCQATLSDKEKNYINQILLRINILLANYQYAIPFY